MSRQDTNFTTKFYIKANGKSLSLNTPVVMGIINFSVDSFYEGSRFKNDKKLLNAVEKQIKDGATIIDIGAMSSRPGSKKISGADELKKLLPGLKAVRKHFPAVFISVDTYRSAVVKAVADNGADMVNDISGGELDEKMYATVAKVKLPYILMHMKGKPENMQENISYKGGVVKELKHFFKEKIGEAEEAGIKQLIVDPGFGFGKTLEHNYEILNRLKEFEKFSYPILVGISRKSMINKVLNISPDKALNGTSVLNTIALMSGANILRVHDVKEATEAIKLFGKLVS